ncbi:MFS transporter [Roseovarius faecimaris]|uniref:MFS transporter n=1 Tax=Roseovarius faecimaris TaxID=2494550 RepID=A0A6I6IMX9_9RHOB|nr:MFS transporter [Roseovarius faecimaris]QGX97153.1 MFS transporter [Roseovarius faecimaris]
MRAGLTLLLLAYVLSQFFRAFLAVLSGVLETDLGSTPDDLSAASGLWFLTFAAMQIPVGAALDRIGPRRTAAVLLLIGGGGGAVLFGLAASALHIKLAMALIGVGCAPVLMASYYIFARQFPPAQFATLAALMVGAGSVGNLIAAYPMAWAAESFGWRASLFGLASISIAVALGILALVRDPPPLEADTKGSLLDLLRMPALWLIFPMIFVSYAPAAAIRGLWIGPYLSDTFGLTTAQIGQATLIMGMAMILGALAYGPLDRLLGTRKWVVFGGSAACLAALLGLILLGPSGAALSIALCAAVGFFGISYPVVMAHGRSLIPPHLTGRGVTLLNLFSIGGAGVVQYASGPLHVAAGGGAAGYTMVFGFFAALLALGMVIYLFSSDKVG